MLKTFHICCSSLYWALSNYVDLCWEFYHALKIKVMYTPPNICYTSTLEVSKNMPLHFHPHKYSLFASMIFLHHFHKWGMDYEKVLEKKKKSREKNMDTWRSMKKMWGHILVHSRAKKTSPTLIQRMEKRIIAME